MSSISLLLGFRVYGLGFRVSLLFCVGAYLDVMSAIAPEDVPPSAWQLRELTRPLLGGSWYLLTTYNCTYNPLLSPFSALIWL